MSKEMDEETEVSNVLHEIEFWVSQDAADGPGAEVCSIKAGNGMVMDLNEYREYKEWMTKRGADPIGMGVPWDGDKDKSVFIKAESKTSRSMVTVRLTRAQITALYKMVMTKE